MTQSRSPRILTADNDEALRHAFAAQVYQRHAACESESGEAAVSALPLNRHG